MAGWILANPSFIGRLIGPLVPGVRGKTDAVTVIVQTAVNRRDAEDHDIARPMRVDVLEARLCQVEREPVQQRLGLLPPHPLLPPP